MKTRWTSYTSLEMAVSFKSVFEIMLQKWFLFSFITATLVGAEDSSNCLGSIDYATVEIVEKCLHTPPVGEVVKVLSAGLLNTFESVEVSVVDSLDFTMSPFNLTSPGMSGHPKLIEIGGLPYLMPLIRRDKSYDLVKLLKFLDRDSGFLIGAAGGPWPDIQVNSEAMINLSVRNGTVDQGSRVAVVEPVGAPKGLSKSTLKELPATATTTTMVGNYLLSDGTPGEVIKVVVKRRIGESDFVTAIREVLQEHYGHKVVGLGGMFLLREGRAKFHVMPSFQTTLLCTDSEFDNWLHYFDLEASINNVGTLVTGDLGLDLREQHFHGWSDHGDGGHYHYDTTPDTVEYEGYFTLAESIVRVDAPKSQAVR